MEALVDEGLVRSIGVANFSIAKLERLLAHARILPAVCQVEMHPFWRNDRVLEWCASKSIHVTGECSDGPQRHPQYTRPSR